MRQSNKIIVLISGNGTNLQSLIDYQLLYDYEIVAVLCNNPEALGIQKAIDAKIEYLIIDHRKYDSRLLFDTALATAISQYNSDLIVLAGFMRILGKELIDKFPNKIINLHPSLLPNYKGLNTHERVLADKQQQHGCTIHFVISELDCGAHIAQALFKTTRNDTIKSLKNKVQSMEYIVYPWIVSLLIKQRIKIQDNQVLLDNQILPKTGYIINETAIDKINAI